MFYTIDVEARIRADHPLRALKRRFDGALRGLDALFARAYSQQGRPSVPPERLLKALLLMALYSIRSERRLCERIDADLTSVAPPNKTDQHRTTGAQRPIDSPAPTDRGRPNPREKTSRAGPS